MIIEDETPVDLLRRAIEIGENMIRIADAVNQPVAGNYFSIGLDILRGAAEAESSRVQAMSVQNSDR